jgi:hypothetical protein
MREKGSPSNPDLASLLSSKIEAFEEFHTVTILLGRTIGEKDISKVEKALNLRERQLEYINMIDCEINKVSRGNVMSARSADKNIDELCVKLEKVIRKTQNNDNSCLDSAIILLKETGDYLMFIDRGLNAFQGYSEKRARESRFLDIKT